MAITLPDARQLSDDVLEAGPPGMSPAGVVDVVVLKRVVVVVKVVTVVSTVEVVTTVANAGTVVVTAATAGGHPAGPAANPLGSN